MEKIFKSSDERMYSKGNGYVIGGDNPDYLVGRLLTIIESIGLQDGQEKAVKSLIRSEVYGQLETTVHIDGSLRTLIHEFTEWRDTQPILAETGISSNFKDGDYSLSFKSI